MLTKYSLQKIESDWNMIQIYQVVYNKPSVFDPA